MDFQPIVDRLTSGDQKPADVIQYIKTCASKIAAEITNDKLKIIDLVKGLNSALTNSTHDVRSRGVDLLVRAIMALPKNKPTEKEIELITEFICLRLIDHKSMEMAALDCLSHFTDCDNKPPNFNKQVMEFIKEKANIHKMDAKTRHKVYELLKRFVIEKKRITNNMGGEFIYSLVAILEGENNPDNLMLCFGMVTFILKNFDNVEPYLDDIFEWLSSYYPVDYTPAIERGADSETNISSIQRSDLVDALYECFYANNSNAENLQTLLLEKVDSNLLSSQLESLECLIKCYEKPFPLASITRFNSTLWTAIRMNCLKKIENVDPQLLDACLKTLTALSRRLIAEKDLYFTFISDMYDELAIAFRKPEMDLFDTAARLLTHSILPSIVGFNFVLGKLLPVTLNALEANELRPLSGLDYMFKQLSREHPNEKIEDNLADGISKLASRAAGLIETQNQHAVSLLESIIRQKIELNGQLLIEITETLKALLSRSNLDVEKCLALICSNYRQFKLITNEELSNYDLNSLIKIMYQFEPSTMDLDRFSVYLRLVILELIDSPQASLDSLDQLVLKDALIRLREILPEVDNQNVIEKSALIHAILLNKLDSKSADQISMSIFSSKYCQNLMTTNTEQDLRVVRNVYLPHIRNIFKSLVLRNHHLAKPIINLILNCIISEKADCDLAYDATKTFSFVLADDDLVQAGFQVFALYKQKFYMQTSKEIRLRFDQMQSSNSEPANKARSDLLIFAIASQLAHLPLNVFRRDQEWLVRQLLRTLSSVGSDRTSEQGACKGGSFVALPETFGSELYKCLESLIRSDCDEVLTSFLPSIIDLNIKNAQRAKSMDIRRQALLCLTRVATSFKDSDLIVYRSRTLDELRACLADKKRLVRHAAGEARLRWTLVGQPVGSV